jgi:hypothetical protein
LYEVVKDEKIREKAMELIETEDDDTVWKVR